MVTVKNKFFTNLDLAQPYLSRLMGNENHFAVGDNIRFTVDVGGAVKMRSFELRVCAKTFDVKSGAWLIELHLPLQLPAAVCSIGGWEAWFRRHIRGEDL